MKRQRKRKFFRTSNIISLCAFLISVVTLFALLYQNWLIKKQQFASVLPILEVVNTGPASSDYSLVLWNNGVGPAFIKAVKIHYKDSIYETDPVGFLEQVILDHDTINFIYSNLRPGKVIPAGGRLHLVEVNNSVADAAKLRALFGEEEAKLEVVYASVYEETWRKMGMDDPAVKVD